MKVNVFSTNESMKTIMMTLYLQANCIRDYYWLSACTRLTEFPTSSVLLLARHVPDVEWTEWYVRFPTCRHIK